MRKTVSILTFFLFFVVAFTLSERVSAEWKQNTIINQSSTPVDAIYSTWQGVSNNLPSGYRTRGYYRIEPGHQRTFQAWKDNRIYFQFRRDGQTIKPTVGAETFRFWVHPSKEFVVVSQRLNGTVLRDKLTHTSRPSRTLRRKDGFMWYMNGSEVKVDSSWVSVIDEGETDPDVPSSVEGGSVDVNGDGVVDISDLAEVGSRLGQSGAGNAADVDGDGIVTVDDIQLVSDAVNDSRFVFNAIRELAPLEGMVLIPAGEFEMGDHNSLVGIPYFVDEGPVHTVYVDAFYMDRHEVTNADFKRFVLANPQWQKGRVPRVLHDGSYLHDWTGNRYPTGKANHPVVYVSWYAAMAYAEWAGKRLPTEAEWEKAARGGLKGKKYPWGNTIDPSRANYARHIEDTTPVGSYPANGYGLFDMVGNVYEWCLDAYNRDFYSLSPARNPLSGVNTNTIANLHLILNNYTQIKPGAIGTGRVIRGGSWGSWATGPGARSIRVDSRSPWRETSAAHDLGFRCARNVTY